ncbi:MAG: Unknown protein [uncultured Campylobacterales bacterium]|uniref:Uncharacterized protein n=1 Tax=uncultured Campylobacterales bacterium TaxID=352960 RepID=A0A6S6S6C2_9BACT|nr:MAG: Unknown protein [uncultured Campylobacterales bacterium]
MKEIKTFFIDSNKQVKKSLISGAKPTDKVDGEELAKKVEDTCNELISKGYNIIDVIPITSGSSGYSSAKRYGYGYSYTSGMMIVTSID